jgi:predicted nuclease of predicted toxin-antitoxin system
VRWLIDAQLPRRLAVRLMELGHDAVHTRDLPRGNRSTDSDLCRIADASARILVSKDRDFLDSFYINSSPSRLLWVTVGNVTNTELLILFESMLPDLQQAFACSKCIEITSHELIVHR